MTRIYFGLWNKYRPAILKMMIDADNEPQSYQLSNHEFRTFDNQKNGVYSFTLEVANGKIVSCTKGSFVAKDLWEILQLSRKASELISTCTYQFSMDRHFKLLVSKINL